MSFDAPLYLSIINFWLFRCQEGISFADSAMTAVFFHYFLFRCLEVDEYSFD